MSVLWKQSAVDVVGLLRSGEISPVEAVQAAIARIEAVDGKTNALPIHCFDRAIERAETLDLASHRQNPKSLCGLPIAVKDYNDVVGDHPLNLIATTLPLNAYKSDCTPVLREPRVVLQSKG